MYLNASHKNVDMNLVKCSLSAYFIKNIKETRKQILFSAKKGNIAVHFPRIMVFFNIQKVSSDLRGKIFI